MLILISSYQVLASYKYLRSISLWYLVFTKDLVPNNILIKIKITFSLAVFILEIASGAPLAWWVVTVVTNTKYLNKPFAF